MTRLQTVLSREVPAAESIVVTAGEFCRAGSRPNHRSASHGWR
ncbi:amidohydrolase [Streptomyces sp. AcE210]|nr:amidohydrolase [Streptomyces sp. AcE210]